MPVNLWHWVQALIVCGSLIYAAVDDLKTRTVNDGICILIALAGLMTLSPASFLGAVLCAFPMYLLSGMGKCGAGDVFLTAPIGFVLGPRRVLFGFVLLMLALLIYLVYLKCKGKSDNRKLPLVPFFAISFIPAYFI